MVKIGSLLVGLLILTTPAFAGTYAFVSRDTGNPPIFAIVHTPGFNGSGGQITVSVCAAPGNPELVQPIQGAIATWNSFTATTGNCTSCIRVEDIPGVAPVGQHIESVILHELGHAAFGIDHTNFTFGMQTSATAAIRTQVVDFGADGIRGSSDDQHFPQPPSMDPALIIHWFRNTDNNPITIDGLVIDDDTFTRSRIELPQGHTWPASANSDHRFPGDDTADLLGSPNTQTVMYSFQSEDLIYAGLSADDVNTVKMARTGLDKDANSGDDYTSMLVFEPDCTQADIEVRFVEPGVDQDLIAGTLGVTVAFVTGIPDPPNQTQHFFMRPRSGQTKILIKMNGNLTWDFDIVFVDDFESGDTSSWSITVP